MGRRRHTPEQIITALREAEVGLANGKTVGQVSREAALLFHYGFDLSVHEVGHDFGCE